MVAGGHTLVKLVWWVRPRVKYNLYLGAGLDGMRLNKLYRQAITHEEIVAELKPVLQDFAGNRSEGERFGDFCIRSGYVKATGQGADFHD